MQIERTPGKRKRIHDIVGGQFRLTKKRFGSGSFGDIYQCVDERSGKIMAAKVEPQKSRYPQLHLEHRVYSAMASSNGFPKVHWRGRGLIKTKNGVKNMNILVMDALGHSLEKLFNICDRKFDVKTVCMIGIQLINRIHSLHKVGYLHRDIKPDNFLIGSGDILTKSGSVIHMIDMGLAKPYTDVNGNHIPIATGKHLTGTPRYASINTHEGIEPSRRDDLESMCYVLVYFLKGKLPWQGLKNSMKAEHYRLIYESKREHSADALSEGLPDEFRSLLSYIRTVEFSQEPDYKYMKKLLQLCCTKQNTRIDWIFQWQTPKFQGELMKSPEESRKRKYFQTVNGNKKTKRKDKTAEIPNERNFEHENLENRHLPVLLKQIKAISKERDEYRKACHQFVKLCGSELNIRY